MATISGYDSSSLGVLFSSINTSKNATVSKSLFGGSADLLGINYSDYASIRSGSYHKLLSAYYSRELQGETDSDKTAESKRAYQYYDYRTMSTSVSKDDSKVLAAIEGAAGDLKDSAAKLQTTGTKSLFKEVTTTDKEGNTSTGYDKDAIYKAVNSFVDDYNDLLDSASKSKTTNILRTTRSMENYTKVNENALNAIGITIDEDKRLSINEETLKKADMSKVKSLFQDRGSYGYQMMTQAAMVDTYAKSEAAKANTYSSQGSYTYNYTTGELYNSLI